MKQLIELTGPYDARRSLGFLQRQAAEQIDLVDEAGTYKRLFFRDGRAVLLEMAQRGDVENPVCEVSLAGEAEPGDMEWAAETARWLLNDGTPLQPFYDFLADAEPELAERAQQFRGLRPPLSPTLFETLAFAIVGQQVNLAFAYQCRVALEDRFAKRAVVGGREYVAALDPGDLEGAELPELRAMKISNAKGRAILELAESLRAEPLDRHDLAGLDNGEIIARLTAHRGIGPWTAEYTMIRALGILDVLPGGDAGLANAIKRWRGLEAKPSEEEIRAIGEKWGPYKALATVYLWAGLGG